MKKKTMLLGGLALLVAASLARSRSTPTGAQPSPPKSSYSAASGVDLINRLFPNLSKKPTRRLIEAQQPGETAAAYNARFNMTAGAQLNRVLGVTAKSVNPAVAAANASARSVTDAISASGDVAAGTVGMTAFQSVIDEAKRRSAAGQKSTIWYTDITKNLRYVRSSIQQGVRERMKSGAISYAEYERQNSDAIAAFNVALAEIQKYR